ncbi:hypothetical protein [Streptomyces luteireticuli]|uniref:hypothetical protein n=1 Tax=Streptomyces luteireticuli TaxID=173858 RepID=UPI0035563DD6
MTSKTSPVRRLKQNRRRRVEALAAFEHARKVYEIALLDDLTATIVTAVPQATHLTFDPPVADGQLLRGIWTVTRDGRERQLINRQDLDLVELNAAELDGVLYQAFDLFSVAWTATRPHDDTNPCVLDFPPADRETRMSTLVREHYPEAQGLMLNLTSHSAHLIAVHGGDTPFTVIRQDSDGRPESALFPDSTQRQIVNLAVQLAFVPGSSLYRTAPTHGRVFNRVRMALKPAPSTPPQKHQPEEEG